MNLFVILPYYFIWHYGKAFFDIYNIWKDFLIFIYNFFSIRTLFFTLFSPWRRMGDEYGKNMNLEEVAGTFILNIIMRCVGAVTRLIFMTIGVVGLILTVCVGFIVFIIWFFLPAIFMYFIYLGITKLSK